MRTGKLQSKKLAVLLMSHFYDRSYFDVLSLSLKYSEKKMV